MDHLAGCPWLGAVATARAHTFIEDEPSALARLLELGAKRPQKECVRTTGTDDVYPPGRAIAHT